MTQPNILIFMVDQLNGTLFPDGPADFLHAPNLKKLAARSARFASTYCASPLCAPSRAAFMSGRLPSVTGVYDNAAEFPSAIPTFAHYLRLQGYQTCLSGKMHFVGPDQLHGFEERLTTDIYPPDFGWTPDWSKPDQRIDWWYHNLGSVTGAGVGETSNQLEYDDEVAHFARQKLYDLSRRKDDRPFCLTVSFTHPHDPYVARKKYWDLYPEESLPPIAVPDPGFDNQDPHSQRIYSANDFRSFDITDQHRTDSRRAYFANISYLDDQIGQIMDVLEAGGFADNTVIAFVSDHGDMLGERGLWFKMSPYEGSARVPMMICAPDALPAGLVTSPTSTLDMLPTLMALAGGDPSALECEGMNLLENDPGRTVRMEYAAEGSIDPIVMLRRGPWKFTYCEIDPPQLFNLQDDPQELVNLAETQDVSDWLGEVEATWDIAAFRADVHRSQQQRLVTYAALRNGNYYPWDFQPLQLASERYMRNHMDLNILEASQRWPRGD